MECALCPEKTDESKTQFWFVVRGICLCESCYEREVVEPVKASLKNRLQHFSGE